MFTISCFGKYFYVQNNFRGQPELKEKIATCGGIIGGILGNEAGR